MSTISAAAGQIGPRPDATPARPSIAANRISDGSGVAAALLVSGWLFAHSRTAWSISAALAIFVPVMLACVVLMIRSAGAWSRDRVTAVLGRVLLAALTITTAEMALKRWEERGTNTAAAATLASATLNLLGYHSAAEHGMLLLDHPDGTVMVAPTAEKLAIIPFFLLAVAWFALKVACGNLARMGGLLAGLGILLIVAMVRFVFTLLIYLEHDQILVGDPGQAALDLFGSPWITIPALLLAGLVLDRASLPSKAFSSSATVPRRHRGNLAAGALMLGIGGLVGLAWSYSPPGEEKSGRILIDDRFCGIWEPTARRLDTEWYGDFSTYSFTSLAEWLGKWFSVDANIGRQYDDDLLSRYDILVIKTPEETIPDREAEAIDRFVRRGGGLLLVGDHTNLLGMGTHLNALSAKYGIRFRYDSVSDGATGGFVNYSGPPIGRHVGALHVDHLEFMTSCSLQLSGTAEAVLAVDGCRREPHDYASSSFFGRHGPHPEMEHGRAVLAATVRVGEGRIAAFTDSTVWSSFAVFDKDREKLAMDLVRLLNRKDSPYELPIRIVAVVALIAAFFSVGTFIRSGLAITAVFFALSGLWLGIGISEHIHRRAYAWPLPNSPVDEVTFLWQGGACAFPPVLGSLGSLQANQCFDTMLVSIQRVGLVPRVAYSYEELLRPNTRAIFAVSPVDAPPAGVIERLKIFVREGGNLVVVDDFRYGIKGSAKEFLSAFDVPITYHSPGSEGKSGQIHVHLGGGMTPVAVPAADAFMARKPHGRGQVVYLSNAADFSREGLGHCFARPGKAAQARYETIFLLLRDLLGIAPSDRRFYGIID
jgi:hypothetical protein